MTDKEIELLIKYDEEYVSDTYILMYRFKNTGRMFGKYLPVDPWKHIYHAAKVGNNIGCEFPMAFSSYNDALYVANKIKENPELIEQYNQEKIKLYNYFISKRDQQLEEKNKHIII